MLTNSGWIAFTNRVAAANITPMKPLVLRSAIVASIGGLIFGFDTAVISGTTESLKTVFNLDDAGLGITVTTAIIGTILGAFTAGKPADKYGRRTVLFVIGALYIVGALGSATAPNLDLSSGRVLSLSGLGSPPWWADCGRWV